MTRDQWREWCRDEPDASATLMSARWVAHTEKSPDDSQLEKDYREVRKNDRVKWLSILGDLEGEYLKAMTAKMKKQEDSAPGPDLGSAKTLEVAEALLRDLVAAQKVKCPQCGCEFQEAV